MAISHPSGLWTAAYLAAWFFVSYLYHGLGITLGYHRLLTHKSLKVPQWVKYLVCSGGYLCLMGAPIVWVGVHRLHHQKSDQAGDPHSPVQYGFKEALTGWMFHMYDYQSDEELQRSASDLMEDPIFRALGTTHEPWQAQMCLGINIAFRAVLWVLFGFWPMFLNALAMGIIFWSPQFVNTFCHLKDHGYRLFETRDASRNVWWVALLSLGEGWHNNHHAIPKSARHGLAWWEVDVTWISIWVLSKLGLAKDIILPAEDRLPWNKKAAAALSPALPEFASIEAPVMADLVPPKPVSTN